MKKVILILLIFLLQACTLPKYTVDPYGYYYNKISIVPMAGNQYALKLTKDDYIKKESVDNLILLKAAEIALKSNFKYFDVVEDRTIHTRDKLISGGGAYGYANQNSASYSQRGISESIEEYYQAHIIVKLSNSANQNSYISKQLYDILYNKYFPAKLP